MTMRDDLAAELAACHEASEVDMPFWRAVASDVIGAGWRPRETLTTKDAETLAEALRKCRVEDGSPAPLFREGDLGHIAYVLIASGAVRREAEVRAEALREAAEVLGDHRTLPELDDKPVFAVMRWLRLRAALAEEGDRG